MAFSSVGRVQIGSGGQFRGGVPPPIGILRTLFGVPEGVLFDPPFWTFLEVQIRVPKLHKTCYFKCIKWWSGWSQCVFSQGVLPLAPSMYLNLKVFSSDQKDNKNKCFNFTFGIISTVMCLYHVIEVA